MSLTLTIDNRPVSGRAGETILQVAADHGIRIPYQFDEFLLISVTVVRISEPYTADLIHQQMEFTYFAFDYDDIIHIKTSGSFIYTALKISIKAKLVIVRQRGYIIHQNRHRCTLFPLF